MALITGKRGFMDLAGPVSGPAGRRSFGWDGRPSEPPGQERSAMKSGPAPRSRPGRAGRPTRGNERGIGFYAGLLIAVPAVLAFVLWFRGAGFSPVEVRDAGRGPGNGTYAPFAVPPASAPVPASPASAAVGRRAEPAEFAVMGHDFRMPSVAPGAPLTDAEALWCARQFVRVEVLFRFTPEGGDFGRFTEVFSLYDERCDGREPAPVPQEGRYGGDLPVLATQVVKETVEEARAVNPGLVLRDASGTGDVEPGTAQHCLAVLGFAPGPADGWFGPRSRKALAAFQAAVGVPADGKLDRRTGMLLWDATYFVVRFGLGS